MTSFKDKDDLCSMSGSQMSTTLLVTSISCYVYTNDTLLSLNSDLLPIAIQIYFLLENLLM